MNLKLLAATIALLGAGSWAQGAVAGIVLSDNFDSDTPVITNWQGDSVFLSIPQPGNTPGQPSVDLVGAADGYANLAYHGNSVDLDGSTGSGFMPAGEIQSITSLPTGTYRVYFEMAGNLRGASNQTTEVSIGGQSLDVTPSSNSQPYMPYEILFTGASGQVAFTDLGPADQQGDLVDNIVVVSGVPEAATWTMMLMGVGLIGAGVRLARRKDAMSMTAY